MDKLNVNPTLADGDLLELSPLKMPNPILKPSQMDNLLILQTPVQKNLKVSFLTPAHMLSQRPKNDENLSASTPVFQPPNAAHTPPPLHQESEVVNPDMLDAKRRITLRRVGISCRAMLDCTMKSAVSDFSSCSAVTIRASRKLLTETDAAPAKWDSLRQLDEESHCKDEVETITKLDREENITAVNQYVNENMDQATDASESKSGSAGSVTVTPASLPFKSPSASQNSNVIFSPIAKVSVTSDDLAPGSQVMTPMSRRRTSITASIGEGNATFCKEERSCLDSGARQSENDCISNSSESSFKNGNDVLKPPLEPLLMQNQERSTMRKSQSVSDGTSVRIDKIASRPCSADSVNGRYVNPFSPYDPADFLANGGGSDDAKRSASSVFHRMANTTYDINAPCLSALSTLKKHNFAMRPVDSEFGSEEFVDSAALLNQGCMNLDLDYLDQKTSGAISSDLRKQSLFVKFDPLLEGIGGRQSAALLGRKSDIIDFTGRVTPVTDDKSKENVVSPREPDLLCDSPSHVTAQNRTFSGSQITRGSEGQDSTCSASPSLQNSVENNPDTGIIEVLQYSEEDVQKILRRREDKYDKLNKTSIEDQQKMREQLLELKIITEENEKRNQEMSEKVAKEKKQSDGIISAQHAEKRRVDAKRSELNRASSEIFRNTDTLQKSLMNYQANELEHNEQAKMFREKYNASQKRILELEVETAEKLKNIRDEIAATKSSMAAQLHSIQIKMKAAKLRSGSLLSMLDHQRKENQELIKICDELATSELRG